MHQGWLIIWIHLKKIAPKFFTWIAKRQWSKCEVRTNATAIEGFCKVVQTFKATFNSFLKSMFNLRQSKLWLVDDRSRFFTEIPNRTDQNLPNRTDTEVEIFFASNKSDTFGVYIYSYLLFSLTIDRILSRVGKNGYWKKKILKISSLLPKFSAISSNFIKKWFI